jgi:hypothetical protein
MEPHPKKTAPPRRKPKNLTPPAPRPQPTQASVEKLFPFARKARIFIVGRETLERSKSRLQFILITADISETSKRAIVSSYSHYPILQCYQSEELEQRLGLKGTKVVGFAKNDLSKAIYAGLKHFRLNKPAPVAAANLAGADGPSQ